MNVIAESALLDEQLLGYRQVLGADYDGYRNHCMRVFNFCSALSGKGRGGEDQIVIAAVFHDLGIWTESTFDYLLPSQRLARSYLEQSGRDALTEEIDAMIGEHHKLTKYKADPLWLVEPFRKADWIDITGGLLRFRLPDDFVTDVMDAFPNEGFHKKLLELFLVRLKSHPFSPLPMMKL